MINRASSSGGATALQDLKGLIKRYVPGASALARVLAPMWQTTTEGQRANRLWSILLARLGMADPDIFIVEIGANDGVFFDPIHAHVIRYGWKGLLVEPLPDFFRQLVETYRAHPDLFLENVAIAEHPGYRDMYRVSPDGLASGTVPAWAKGIASFFSDRNALGGHRISAADFERIRPYVEIERVRCEPLDHLLRKHNVAKIDLLQIDVEGYDYQVLKQLDFDRFRPRVIRMEWCNLPDDEKRLTLGLLQFRGYRIHLSTTDLIAWRDLGITAHLLHRARHFLRTVFRGSGPRARS